MPALPEVPATSAEVTVRRWRDGSLAQVTDVVAEEAPVALTYHGVPHVVMMATPSDLEELGVGFTLSEAIVAAADEIRAVEVLTRDGALEVRVDITGERFSAVLQRQRNLTGRTGCGVCGAHTVEEAIRHPPPVKSQVQVSTVQLHEALAALRAHQPLNLLTGSVHAAAWVVPGAGVKLVREDVGRHNALDKVIGALVRGNLDRASGYLVITSRASYEMVQKAATVGIGLIAAVSAPTALAIRLAEHCGITLVGFAREHRHVVYANGQRLT
ncbi:MAG: formate dehydrogenase accessory sulfurtransferase FdhD [Gammaproteobacteria bacterium]|nr:formate dehydrogenase accessory sulfurtransferase FdhD [Gammaproteobacteria bacterium]